MTAESSRHKAGVTKRKNYDSKLRIAVLELANEGRVWPIEIREICRRAGVSEDPLGKAYHSDLRAHLVNGPSMNVSHMQVADASAMNSAGVGSRGDRTEILAASERGVECDGEEETRGSVGDGTAAKPRTLRERTLMKKIADLSLSLDAERAKVKSLDRRLKNAQKALDVMGQMLSTAIDGQGKRGNLIPHPKLMPTKPCKDQY